MSPPAYFNGKGRQLAAGEMPMGSGGAGLDEGPKSAPERRSATRPPTPPLQLVRAPLRADDEAQNVVLVMLRTRRQLARGLVGRPIRARTRDRRLDPTCGPRRPGALTGLDR